MQNPKLSDQQRAVLFDKATEAPFSGSLLYTSKDGVYACANCHAVLFASGNKFESGCGWPSFDAALPGTVTMHPDISNGMVRTEVTCLNCGGHLGHVFDDGPSQTTGQRYCINSLAMEFDEHPAASS